MVYHARYFSSNTTLSGCVKQFITSQQHTQAYPSSVIRYCDLCKKEHNFSLQQIYTVATPLQQKSFREHWKQRDTEQDVQIKVKE